MRGLLGAQAGRIAALMVALTMIAGGAIPGLAARPSGGVPTIVANVILGDRTFRGFFVDPGDVITVRQKRNGSQIASRSTTAVDTLVSLRLKSFVAGDRLEVTQNGDTRTITVPDLRLIVDAGRDRVSGRIPAGSPTVTIAIAREVGPYTLGGYTLEFAPAPDGTFARATGEELQGGEEVELRWTNPSDDQFRVITAAPAVTVQVGQPTVQVHGKRGTTSTITLRSAGGTVRGTARVTHSVEGHEVTGTFRKSGVKVKVRAGDRVIHSAAPSVAFTVLRSTLHLDPAGGGAISATCFPNGWFVLGRVFGGGAFDYLADGVSGSTGAIALADIAQNGTTLPSGYRILLICENTKGYAQTFPAKVP